MAWRTEHSGSRPAASALTLAALLLGALAGGLVVALAGGDSRAVAQDAVGPATGGAAGAAGNDTYVVAGQIANDTYGLYVVDLARKRICAYQWTVSPRKLRLMAVRNYAFDLGLEDYNTEKSPREIKELVEQSKQLQDTP